MRRLRTTARASIIGLAPIEGALRFPQVSYAEDGSAESDFEDAEAERRARVAKRAAAVPALLTDAVEDADEVERVITHRQAPIVALVRLQVQHLQHMKTGAYSAGQVYHRHARDKVMKKLAAARAVMESEGISGDIMQAGTEHCSTPSSQQFRPQCKSADREARLCVSTGSARARSRAQTRGTRASST